MVRCCAAGTWRRTRLLTLDDSCYRVDPEQLSFNARVVGHPLLMSAIPVQISCLQVEILSAGIAALDDIRGNVDIVRRCSHSCDAHSPDLAVPGAI